jgi:hypothetical protein
MNVSQEANRLGREVCGPVFVPFCDWVSGEAVNAGLQHVLFLARDGQLLKKITDIRHQGAGRFQSHYVSAGSRASWYRCTPHIISREILEFRIGSEYLTLGKACEALGFEHEVLADRLSLPPERELSPAEQQRLAAFLSSRSGRGLLQELTQSNRDIFITYLRQLGICENEKIAMVDVGWNGHFQSSLEVILEPLGVEVHGFYFGLNRVHHGSSRKTFMYGPRDFPNWMAFYPCLIEMLTPADHPSVSVLLQDGDRIVPRFAGPPVAEPEIVHDIHAGALEFAAGSPPGVERFDLKNFVENPPEFAVSVLSRFYFQKPFSPEIDESFIQRHSIWEAAWLSFSFKRHLDRWHWPQANLRISGFNWLGTGLNTRFVTGYKAGRKLERVKRILSRATTLARASLSGLFDFRKHDLVSFDVFDTLVFRRCGGFFKVFEEMEQRTKIDGFARLRKRTEIRLLLELGREINLDEIYEALNNQLPGHDWTAIREMELDIEQANLRASPRGRRALNKARRSGATIAFLSDMYLSEQWIRDQLRRHSIWNEGDLLFVSGELGANKRSGELFGVVREQFPEASWKHSGDNLLSDLLVAYGFGISVRWLPHSYIGSIRDHLFRLANRNRWLEE